LTFFETSQFVQPFEWGEERSVGVAEKPDCFEITLDKKKKIHVYKQGDFNFEQLFQMQTMTIKNLLQINTLQILKQIIRSSEACGVDNTVYLLYEDKDFLLALSCVIDFENLLEKNNFYICFEEKAMMSEIADIRNIKPLRISEMETLVFLYQPQSNGYEFFRDVIQNSSYVVYADGWVLHRKIEDIENILGIEGEVKKLFLNVDRRQSCTEFLKKLLNYPQLLQCVDNNISEILRIFLDLFGMEQRMNTADIMKAFFISKYYFEQKNWNMRVAPIIVYFPDHYERFIQYYANIQKEFQRVLYFRLVRNPVIKTIRAYEYIKEKQLFYFSKFVQVLLEELHFDYYSVGMGNSYAVRFEDLKEQPEVYLKKICSLFLIPYEDKLIENNKLFRKDALSPEFDKIFSDEDIRMLKTIYQRTLQYYEYEDEVDDDYAALKDYRFGFEEELASILGIDTEMIHIAVQMEMEKYIINERRQFPVWIK
jgi:hypothetical protein